MNTKPLLLTAALLGVLPAALFAQAVAPAVPTGTINVDTSIIRVGGIPSLDWEAIYPTPVLDVISINPDNSLTTKKPLTMEVRVLGVAFQSGSQLLPASVHLKVGSNRFQQIFLGGANNVNPNSIRYTATVPANTRVDFRFQAASGANKNNPKFDRASDWNWNYPVVDTTSTTNKLMAKPVGSPVPDYAPAYSQGNITSFLRNYLTPDGQTVKIGPRDVIYLTELSTAAPGHWAFDMQDAVILVTFKE